MDERLIDSEECAKRLGLANKRAMERYRRNHPDMPCIAVGLGFQYIWSDVVAWLRSEHYGKAVMEKVSQGAIPPEKGARVRRGTAARNNKGPGKGNERRVIASISTGAY